MTFRKTSVLIFALSLSVTACAPKDDKNESSDAPAAAASSQDVLKSFAGKKLSTGCLATGKAQAPGATIEVREISDKSATYAILYYTTSNCDVLSPYQQSASVYNYEAGAASTVVEGAADINLTPVSAASIPYTAQAAAEWNTAQYMDRTDWVSGESKITFVAIDPLQVKPLLSLIRKVSDTQIQIGFGTSSARATSLLAHTYTVVQ